MNPLRWAALLLPVFLAPRLLAAGEPLRLDEIAVSRFVEDSPGRWLVKYGLLNVHGQFRETSSAPVLESVTVPPVVANRILVSYDAWVAYTRLGPEAVISFAADPGDTHYRVSERDYLDIAPAAAPKLSHGRVVNLSSRGYVTPGRPLMGGFVIEDQHRWVLIRAVGPTLATLGVAEPLPNPGLTLYRRSTPIDTNGDWSARDAAEVAAAATQVGAFPLPQGSRDSALLVELPAGVYTAHANSEDTASGEVLLEIYSVPE